MSVVARACKEPHGSESEQRAPAISYGGHSTNIHGFDLWLEPVVGLTLGKKVYVCPFTSERQLCAHAPIFANWLNLHPRLIDGVFVANSAHGTLGVASLSQASRRLLDCPDSAEALANWMSAAILV